MRAAVIASLLMVAYLVGAVWLAYDIDADSTCVSVCRVLSLSEQEYQACRIGCAKCGGE